MNLGFKNNKLNVYFILVIFAIFSAFYNVTLPLHPDEAYYWVWSRDLQLSYYDHPPMVAVFNKFFTLFGDSVFSIRLTAVFSTIGAGFFIFLLAKEIYDEKVGLTALLIFLTLPIVNAGATITTPDAPLSFFWSGALYFAYKAIRSDKIFDYVVTGLFIGGAFLSKYTSVLILASLFIYLVLANRKLLLNYKPWLSILIGFICFIPVIIWNGQNEWISFSFQYNHGGTSSMPLQPKYLVEYILGFIFLMTPVFAFVIILKIFNKKYILDAKESFIPHAFLFMTFFFMYKSLYTSMAPNWYAPITFSASIFAAFLLVSNNYKKLTVVGLILSLLLTVFIRFPDLMGLPSKLNIHNRVFGIDLAAKEFAKYVEEDKLICTDYLTEAAILEFYLPNHPDVHEPFTKRMSYYKQKYKGFDYKGKDCIVFLDHKVDEDIKSQCTDYSLIKKYEAKKEGFDTKEYYFYSCNNLKYGF